MLSLAYDQSLQHPNLMANLIGYLQGTRGRVSRLGSQDIEARLETWEGAITVRLDKDGQFTVSVGPKRSTGRTIATGNVDRQEVDA